MKTTTLSLMLSISTLSFAQNADWGTGVQLTANLNGSNINVSAFDPETSSTQNTSLYVGSGGTFINTDGIVIGIGSNGTMAFVTYDLDLHSFVQESAYLGSSGTPAIINTDGLVAGVGGNGTMNYAYYNRRTHTWIEESAYLGSGNSAIATTDGLVAGLGSNGTMNYAVYDAEQNTWAEESAYLGSTGGSIFTGDGVVVGVGSNGTMNFATYDFSNNVWREESAYLGSGAATVVTSNGVVAGLGSNNSLCYGIYDFTSNTWEESSTYMGSSGGTFSINSGTINYSGSSSGTRGYDVSNSSWGSNPTDLACNLIPVTFSGSDWVYMQSMSMGASNYTYSSGDGHQILRKQGWKRYNSDNNYNVSLNIGNGVNNTSCNTNVNVVTAVNALEIGTLKVFPNPATDVLNIEVPQEFTESTYFKITDIMGKELQPANLRQSGNLYQLDVKGWAQGVYIVQLMSKQHQILYSTKWVQANN